MTRLTDREARLLARYGEILSVRDLAEVYKYASPASVRRAHEQGHLPVPLYKFPTRRGLYALTRDVANSFDSLLLCEPHQQAAQ